VLGEVEAAIRPFGARPHWGKVFTTDRAEVRELWPRLGDAERLIAATDPKGKFGNAFVGRYLRS
jgi:xylitol oxidase